MNNPLPSRERDSIQNSPPSPGGSKQKPFIILPPLAGAGETVYTSSPSPGGRELEGGGFSMKEDRKKAGLARQLRRSETDAEKALWARLRNKQLEDVKFRMQQPLGTYIVDFVSFERKIIVEVDGGQHNEREARGRDEQRAAWLNERGYQVLRFWNNEVLVNMEGVLERIREVLS